MPATFATFPETFPATLAERHAPTRSPGQHGGITPTAQTNLHQLHRDQPPRQGLGAAHDGGKLAAHRKAEMRGGGDATPQGHKQGAQRTRGGSNVGTAARVKAPYRCVKMANKAYNKKSPEYTGSKGKPRTACAMRGVGHFWSLARSKSSRMGCNRIYSKIKSGTPLPRPPDMRRSRARSARPPSGCWRSCPRSAAGSCTVPQYRPS